MLKLTWNEECEVGTAISKMLGGIDHLIASGVKNISHAVQSRTTRLSIPVGLHWHRVSITMTDYDTFTITIEEYTETPWPSYRHLNTIRGVSGPNLAEMLRVNCGFTRTATLPVVDLDAIKSRNPDARYHLCVDLIASHGVSFKVAEQFYRNEMGRGLDTLAWLVSSPEHLAKQLTIADLDANPTAEYLEEKRQTGEFQREYQQQHQCSTAEWRR